VNTRYRSCWARFSGALALLSVMACNLWHLGPEAELQEPEGKDVILGDGVALTIPVAYHEVAARTGRAFRLRGAQGPSYSTIVVQSRTSDHPILLDDALGLTLARLEALENFDLLDVQLFFVGRHLAVSYAADFDLLDVRRRQWGVLIFTARGLDAIIMTNPQDAFNTASSDYFSLISSLHNVDAHPGVALN
jgi:hypothetical protein